MSDEWKPDDDDVEVYFALGATEYKVGEGGVSISEAHDAYRAWLAAHDQALREQIAREIEVMLIGSDEWRHGSEVIAAHDSALLRAVHIARGEGSE